MKSILIAILLSCALYPARAGGGYIYTPTGQSYYFSGNYLYDSNTGQEIGFLSNNYLYSPDGQAIGYLQNGYIYSIRNGSVLGYCGD
jgi:hypothetical protein